MNISYFRATYSSSLKTPYSKSTEIVNHALVATYNEVLNHGDYKYIEVENIYGYKVSKVRVSTVSQYSSNPKYKDVGTVGFLTLNVDNNKFIA